MRKPRSWRICRKLDGVALAIELAAGRVEAYGLQQTAALLDQRLTLLWLGPRTAPPRQKTLQATLDWSFGLLVGTRAARASSARCVRRPFYPRGGACCRVERGLDQARVFVAIESLVAKSMVATRPVGAMMWYRLLDTTRAYALEIHIDDGEFADLAVRHAAYYRRWLERSGPMADLDDAAGRSPHFAASTMSARLWNGASAPTAMLEIGVSLAAAAAPVFLAMSLLTECHRWSERAILALDDATRGPRRCIFRRPWECR